MCVSFLLWFSKAAKEERRRRVCLKPINYRGATSYAHTYAQCTHFLAREKKMSVLDPARGRRKKQLDGINAARVQSHDKNEERERKKFRSSHPILARREERREERRKKEAKQTVFFFPPKAFHHTHFFSFLSFFKREKIYEAKKKAIIVG